MLNYVSRSYLVSYVITIQTYSFFTAILIISRDPHIFPQKKRMWSERLRFILRLILQL